MGIRHTGAWTKTQIAMGSTASHVMLQDTCGHAYNDDWTASTGSKTSVSFSGSHLVAGSGQEAAARAPRKQDAPVAQVADICAKQLPLRARMRSETLATPYARCACSNTWPEPSAHHPTEAPRRHSDEHNLREARGWPTARRLAANAHVLRSRLAWSPCGAQGQMYGPRAGQIARVKHRERLSKIDDLYSRYARLV